MLIVSSLLTSMHKQPIPNAFEAHHIGCNGSHCFAHDYQAFNSEIVFLLSIETKDLLAVLNVLPLLLHLNLLESFDIFLLFFQLTNLLYEYRGYIIHIDFLQN